MSTAETEHILFETEVAGGWNWSHVIKKGTAVRLTDLQGGANVSALFYNAANVTERYNMGDTLKIQHISSLCKGRCIYSDMGRILMSITEDTCGWHDVICGVSDFALIERRFGEKSYQDFRNSFHRNGYDSLLVELAKYGMGRRDFTETVNFFSKVGVDDDGSLAFVEAFSRPGDFVQLRAEMDTLLVLDTGMHPLNPAPTYQTKPVQVSVLPCSPAMPDDPCRTFCPENERGFINTAQYSL
jgi:urea carboxylase-associated protein 2